MYVAFKSSPKGFGEAEIILGVFLKGAGWAELWPKVVILAMIGAVLFALSLIPFRRHVT